MNDYGKNKRVVADHVTQYEVVIDRPAKRVWPYLLNQEKWMNSFLITTISGEPNTEGEIKKVLSRVDVDKDVAKKQYGVERFQPMFFKILRLDPYKQFVYRPFTEKNYADYDYSFTGIAILTLSDLSAKTNVRFNLYLEYESISMTQNDINTFAQKLIDVANDAWCRNLSDLKELVEKG